jgi:hypothetical protein
MSTAEPLPAATEFLSTNCYNAFDNASPLGQHEA